VSDRACRQKLPERLQGSFRLSVDACTCVCNSVGDHDGHGGDICRVSYHQWVIYG
jgi:hypothetical protein